MADEIEDEILLEGILMYERQERESKRLNKEIKLNKTYRSKERRGTRFEKTNRRKRKIESPNTGRRTRIEKPNQEERNNKNKNKRRTTEIGKIKRR